MYGDEEDQAAAEVKEIEHGAGEGHSQADQQDHERSGSGILKSRLLFSLPVSPYVSKEFNPDTCQHEVVVVSGYDIWLTATEIKGEGFASITDFGPRVVATKTVRVAKPEELELKQSNEL